MRLQKLGYLFVAVVLLTTVALAQSQGRFEVSPFAGYETSGSYPVESAFGTPGGSPTSNAAINKLRINSGLNFGAFIDYSVLPDLQLEFLWARNQTYYSQHDFITHSYSYAFDSDADQFQFGVLYPFIGHGFYAEEKKFVPFVAGGLGFTHESNYNGAPNRNAFAFNLGGGVKYYLTKHVGLRGDIRYMPTYANSTPGYACDYFGYCFYARNHNFENRGSFTGGLIFRF